MSRRENYVKHAVDNNYKFIILVKDLEDKEIFPVYFNFEKEVLNYKNNIISESKLKILEIINI